MLTIKVDDESAAFVSSTYTFSNYCRLYITVGKADVAVTMYRRLKMYNDMTRLVKQFFKEHLEATHQQLAKVCCAIVICFYAFYSFSYV
jgi:hypothetical protein